MVEARLHEDHRGLFVRTRRPDEFYLLLNRIVADGEVNIESIAPVDDDMNAVYQYLIGSDTASEDQSLIPGRVDMSSAIDIAHIS